MKSITRLTSAALLAAAIPAGVLFIRAHACGPDWEPEVFVPQFHPASMQLYVDGHLGLIQRSYYHAELVIAYRYLTGAPLSSAEKAVLIPKPEPAANQPRDWKAERAAQEAAQPITQWFAARARYSTTVQPTISPERLIQRGNGTYIYQDNELNCTDGSFLNAAATLDSRAKTWGAQSLELKEWIEGQDEVFANCRQPSGMPSPPKPGWPKLLQQDRAYQIAAAQFYAGNFDDAIQNFAAIGHDTASPWSRWGEYLAARAVVRKAAAGASAEDPAQSTFNLDLLRDAQARLLRITAQPLDAQILHAANDELGFVMVRLDPAARLKQVSTALSQPDPDFRNDLTDLDFLLNREQPVDSSTEMVQWLRTMQDSQPSERGSGPHWLVAKISMAQTPDQDLMAAAASVPASSPAYITVSFHRARLLKAAGKSDEARAIITALLKNVAEQDFGTRNALLQARFPMARNFDEFLADAPRTVVEEDSQATFLAQCNSWSKHYACYKELPALQFDNDAAAAFNKQLPLALWVQAARSTALPQHLRDAVAWAGWLRALGLNDSTTRKQLAPMLPPPIKNMRGDSDGFPATLALLLNPGLQPYLLQGVQRSASYHTFDQVRDNWWCGEWSSGNQINLGNSPGASMAPEPGPLTFLTTAQRQTAEAERAKLDALPNATMWLGQRTLDYVKAHPDDKDAAEALALVVRATHYSCSGEEKGPQRELSKAAFELLHKRYPNTEWARKTKYYY